LLLDNYKNRSFTLTTQISKSAKYQIRNQIKVIKGLNFESEASELNNESVEPMLTEADLVWLDPEILKKADCLETRLDHLITFATFQKMIKWQK
jgi:hypothetical protein